MGAEQLDEQLAKFLEFCKIEKWVIHHINRGYFQWKHEASVIACHYATVIHEMSKNGGSTMEENKQEEVKEEVKAPEAEAPAEQVAPEGEAQEALAEAPSEEAPKEEAPAEAPAEVPQEEQKEESNA